MGGQVANTPVDMPAGLPPWELLVSEPAPPEPGHPAWPPCRDAETVLVLRVHHALADGDPPSAGSAQSASFSLLVSRRHLLVKECARVHTTLLPHLSLSLSFSLVYLYFLFF